MKSRANCYMNLSFEIMKNEEKLSVLMRIGRRSRGRT